MAEAFNCPTCGAPLSYNAETAPDGDTISCPYCNGSVIVPESLRRRPSTNVIDLGEDARAAVITFTQRYEETPRPVVLPTANKAKNIVGTCVAIAIITALVSAVIGFFVINSITTATQTAVKSLIPVTVSTPVVFPTNPAQDIMTQLAPTLEGIKATAEGVKNKALLTPTADVEQTATVEAQATAEALSALEAQKTQIDQQRAWPVVMEEKFTNASRNWTTGQDNNEYAIEDLRISGNKYTWKMTSKKSMGSFSFPDMAALGDVFISCDIQVPVSSSNAVDQVGIIFHHSQEDKTFYYFGVNPAGTYSLRLYDGSSWNDLISLTQTDLLKAGQVNHLAVSMEGSQILLVINDTLVASFEDATLAEGTAGLGVNLAAKGEDMSVVFSNFTVRAPKK